MIAVSYTFENTLIIIIINEVICYPLYNHLLASAKLWAHKMQERRLPFSASIIWHEKVNGCSSTQKEKKPTTFNDFIVLKVKFLEFFSNLQTSGITNNGYLNTDNYCS